MMVRVRYYARLKEQAGVAEERWDSPAHTVAELWTEAASRHGFDLDASLIRAAQDDEFCSWSAPLLPGALVVFMPPVAGG